MIVKLRISDITIPQGLLPRTITSTVEEVVERYAEAMEQGVEFPPIKVWKKSDKEYWIIDGVHRLQAHKRLGKEYIDAELIHCDDVLDYRVNAIRENLKHGLPLTREERKDNARRLYISGIKDPKELAKLFGVAERTIYSWIADLKDDEKTQMIEKAKELRQQGYTQEQIAKELNVPRRTISDWLNEPLAKIENLQNSPNTQPNTTQPEEEDDFQWVWDAVDEMKRQEEEQKQQQNNDDIQLVKLQWQPQKKEKEVKFEDPDEIWKELREEMEEKLSILIDKFGPNDVQELLEDLKIDIALGKYKKWPGYLTMLGLKRIRGREW